MSEDVSGTEIPVGPQHPSLKEPANFTLTVDGEVITGADLKLSYNHRGIEQAVLSKSYLENIYLLERICGICSHAHTTSFAIGVEDLLDLDVPRRANYIRTLIGELERIHSHMLWLGVAGHEIGFDTLWQYAWRDREIVLDLLEEITGNRIHYSINTIGGVRQDLTAEQRETVLEKMDELEERIDFYLETVPNEETVRMRCENVGTVSAELAREYCAAGPVGRASGLPVDVRRDAPYAAYDEMDFDVITDTAGDLLARTTVRIREIAESISIIRQAAADIPDGDLKASPKPVQALLAQIPEDDVVSRYEAPRGELIHYIRADGTDTPERVHIRVPTLANWPTVVEALRGSYIADTPIVVAGIDPCISCTSRIGVETDGSHGGEDSFNLEELREYGMEWYDKRTDGGSVSSESGIDRGDRP
ncbi:NADH dehydrogenase (quinone) [Halorhabdus utahensis DSM 12940]|uniref:NADH dehydrogenase (Quinone) n=1 Tax=Halorhabdus utahensis (strain DSM 12940 / JCM 11049 / AX-2) TaxID=519442 RepID=C7NUN7_HALUD|nr:nickel-dependent hydrogenase large subunit [Halorhabdus utahensis]ACV12394.1 NADH dehydrogenase (quinone) [Halorhabdus utahensis DSM 12940]